MGGKSGKKSPQKRIKKKDKSKKKNGTNFLAGKRIIWSTIGQAVELERSEEKDREKQNLCFKKVNKLKHQGKN